MHQLQNLFIMQITMFILMFAGFVLTKKQLLNEPFRKALTDFLLKFILPCNIIKSFLMEFNLQILKDCSAILLLSFGIQVLSIILGRTIYRKTESGKRETLQYGMLVSNAGFLGNPVMEGIYGAQGLLYASIYLIPVRISMWSLGIACFTGRSGKGVLRRILTHPCIIATIIGLFLMLTGISLPQWITKPITLTGSCNTALSLLVVGGVLASLNPKNLFDKDCLGFCVLRLIVVPLITLGGCLLLHTQPLVTQTAVLLAGMPAPLTAAMLASQYGKDESLAVSMIFVSTLASMITLPLLSILVTTLVG